MGSGVRPLQEGGQQRGVSRGPPGGRSSADITARGEGGGGGRAERGSPLGQRTGASRGGGRSRTTPEMPAALPAALLALLLHAHLGGLAPLNGKRRPRRGRVFLRVEGALTQPGLLPRASRCSFPRICGWCCLPPRQGRCGRWGASALSHPRPRSGGETGPPLAPRTSHGLVSRRFRMMVSGTF